MKSPRGFVTLVFCPWRSRVRFLRQASCLVIASTLAIAQAPSARAADAARVKVLFVKGAASQTSNGKAARLRANSAVSDGSTVSVPRGSHVRLLFINDGTQVDVGSGSQVKVEPTPAQSPSVLKLIVGYSRVQTKPRPAAPAPAGGQPAYVFHVETPHMSVGVSGTDFILATNGTETMVYGVEGTVHLAKDRAALDRGQVTDLPNGTSIRATNSGIGTPRPYDPERLALALAAIDPKLAVRLNPATPEPRLALLRFRLAEIYVSNSVGSSYSAVVG
jgi:hypothetical protein